MSNNFSIVGSATAPRLLLGLLLSGAAFPASAWAQTVNDTNAASRVAVADSAGVHTDSNSILVEGRRAGIDPTALSVLPSASIASVYTVSQDDIAGLSVTTPNELLRNIPGVSVADLGNGGIPNGVTIRGWGLVNDGISVKSTVDDFPRNFVSGGNNNGSNDLNNLIPEVIESIDVVKGPFDSRYGGNFAYAGSAVFQTASYVPTRVSVSVGSFGRRRVLGTFGYRNDDGLQYYIAAEGFTEDGRRENNRQDKINIFGKLTYQLSPADEIEISGQFYRNHYGQPGYTRVSLIESGVISELDASDPNAKGWRNSSTLTAQFHHSGSLNFDSNFYLEHLNNYRSIHRQDRTLIDTYPANAFLDDRWTFGGGINPWTEFEVGGIEAIFRAGAAVHVDSASVDRYPVFDNVAVPQPTALDARTAFFSYNDFTIYNPSLYAELSLKPADWLKFTGGVRNDWFIQDVAVTTYVTAGNSLFFQHIKETVDKPTLRAGVAITPIDGLTLLGNFGEGITSINVNTQLPLNPNLEPTKLNTKEVVLKFADAGLGVSFELGAYHTLNQGELGLDPQSGITVNLGRSVRKGFDIAGRYRVFDRDGTSLNINANYNEVEARLVNPSNAANFRVTGTPPWTAAYGVDAATAVGEDGQRLRFTAQYTFVGPIVRTANGSLISDDYDRLSLKLAFEAPETRDLRIWTSGVIYSGDRYSEMATTMNAFNDGNRTFIVTSAQPKFRFEVGVGINF